MFNQQLSLFGESSVRNIFIQIKTVLASSMILLGSQLAIAATLPGDPGLQMCDSTSNTLGKFALCAASTCIATGTTMDVRVNGYLGGITKFPSATCKCPIVDQTIMNQNATKPATTLPLQALAAVYEGNMKGSCNVDNPSTQIWSLFQPIGYYPQATLTPAFSYPPPVPANPPTSPPTTVQGAAKPQVCKNISGKQLGSNCFSFLCTIDPTQTNGVTTATCTCPLGEGPFGGSTPPGSAYPTEAGGLAATTADKTSFCYQNPVSIPLDIVRQFISYP
jgi:hypothetical protein